MKRLWVPFVLLVLAACSQVTPDPTSTTLTPMAFGTSGYDVGTALAKHSAGVYAVGVTDGNLHATSKGSSDAFLRKYDTSGRVTWGRQFGTITDDYAAGVATDSSNNAYVAGQTNGSLAGSKGNTDMFLRKYTASGSVSWTKQFGTSGPDGAADVAVSGSNLNLYVVGYVYTAQGDANAYLTKFNTSGTQLWTRSFGTATYDVAADVATDSSGNIYVVGTTFGAITGSNGGGDDMFVRKYNTSGSVVWTRQFHYSDRDEAVAVTVNGTSVFVVGQSYYDAANSRDLDIRPIKLNTSGTLGYTYGYGSSLDQYVTDVSVVNGAIFVSGYEDDGENYNNGFVYRFDGSGFVQWTAYQDTSDEDYTNGVLARSASEVYVTGSTTGVLGSANNGGRDAFLRRINGSSGATVWTDQ